MKIHLHLHFFFQDLQKYAELTGDRKENARFGTALANVEDLNQDGYSGTYLTWVLIILFN